MEPPLATLYLLVLGPVFAISALAVDSQPQNHVTVVESQSQPSVSTPSSPSTSPTPPLTLPPPPPPPSSPPPSSPPQPPLSPTPPPPPSKHFSPPPHTNVHEFRKKLPPPSKINKLNKGKKIGLLFAGIAGILQIGVVGFLVYKRWQLLKVRNRYETCT